MPSFFLRRTSLFILEIWQRRTAKALNTGLLYLGKSLSVVQPWDKYIYGNKGERDNQSVKSNDY